MPQFLGVIDPTLLAQQCQVLVLNPAAQGTGLLAAAESHAQNSPPSIEAHPSANTYAKMKVTELKELCRTRGLRMGGKKQELIGRLIAGNHCEDVPPHVDEDARAAEPSQLDEAQFPDDEFVEINNRQVCTDAAQMQGSFEAGYDQDDGNPDDDEFCGNAPNPSVVDTPRTHGALEWADKFILDTRRKSGRITENSVLKLWKSWVSIAIDAGEIPDHIVDSNHMIKYLQREASRQLFNPDGTSKLTSERLSAASLKKTMTMLGRVRRRQEDENPDLKISRPAKTSRTDDFFKAVMIQAQRLRLEGEDFDVTKGTVLDSELRPNQFGEVTDSIMQELTQVPSVIKAHFAWTWQCSTLNRSDELVSLPMACIHPYTLRVPEYRLKDGSVSPIIQSIPGVLALHYETKTARPGKTEPAHSFVLPHRNPLRCPVGALAIMLHYMFDQENLLGRIPTWDWSRPKSWHQVSMLFGRTVDQPSTSQAIGRMYDSFLAKTSIKSSKKAHLARRTIPGIMEEMGVTADQVDAVGHWEGNTRREVYAAKIPKAAVIALAGFPVGEMYHAPWAQVEVPESLQRRIFPFCEAEIARLRVEGHSNQGTYSFLELLQFLRPFYWRAIAAIYSVYPGSLLVKRLRILHEVPEARVFLSKWRELLQAEADIERSVSTLGQDFHETPTRNAFTALSMQLRDMHQLAYNTHSNIEVISRRTEPFSPSKQTKTSQSQLPVSIPGPSVSSRPIQPLHFGPVCPSTPPSIPRNVAPSTALRPSDSPPSLNHAIELGLVPAPTSLLRCSTGGSAPKIAPVAIEKAGRVYYILPLGLGGLQTPHDPILPPPAAFRDSEFPAFTSRNSTWQYIFDKVVEIVKVWEVYAPQNLGDYSDIKALWQVWDEGVLVEGVGRLPALRLIDMRWGPLKNKETKRGTYALWRPRNDNNARKIWSNFYFFIQRIEALEAAGNSSVEAIEHFEKLRGMRSVNQFHGSLQVKKRARDEGEGAQGV